MKDWNGNTRAIFTTNGARNFAAEEREEHDFYATDPIAAEKLLELEQFAPHIWEPACGQGHLAEVFKRHGYDVLATDLINRGYGVGGVDFFKCDTQFDGDIITNPPHKYAKEFVEHALELIPPHHKVAMFLKLTFLEGKGRQELFQRKELKTLYVSSARLACAKNAEFDKYSGTAVAYGWYVFEREYNGDPVIKWF